MTDGEAVIGILSPDIGWENLGYSCEICNNKKSSKYDAGTPYLDPYAENPEEHLVFLGWYLFAKNGSERGEITLRDIGLNRAELIEQRKERIEKLVLAINACQRTSNDSLRAAALISLIEEAAPDKEYSYAVRCALIAHQIVGVAAMHNNALQPTVGRNAAALG